MARTTAFPRQTARRPAGDDRPVAKGSDLTVLTAIRQYKQEAKRARWSRILKNRANLRMFIGEQDYSYKVRGQSKEFIPKLPMAVEQFSSAIKRALTDFGDWFRTEVRDAPLTGEELRSLLLVYLGKLTDGYLTMPFPVLISDAMKIGALNSLIVLKVHGDYLSDRRFVVERGLQEATVGGQLAPRVTHTLKRKDVSVWRPWIDLLRDEDYYPDPRGHGLYEIQEIETDLAHLQEWAEDGIYDDRAVARITEDFQNLEQETLKSRLVGQDLATPPSFRKRVILDELWGTVLGPTGRIVKKNCVATVANDKYLVRSPVDNPWWHGESPFVTAPILRVPHSVWHKALADHGSALNIAMNELYNLMLDGGLAAVWGIKQLHTDWLEDPKTVSDGIPQGVTLQVNDRCPPGGKALEIVATGGVPQDALAMYNISDREFNAGMMTNDLKFGMVPPKQVKACVPLFSEALTRGGWRGYKDLTVGDEILAFNPGTGGCEWTPILDLYYHPAAETVLYVSKRFRAMCTPNHKWVSCYRGGGGSSAWAGGSRLPAWKLLPLDETNPQRELLQAAPALGGKGLGVLPVHELLCRPKLPEQILLMTSLERQAFILGLLAGEGSRDESAMRKGPGRRPTIWMSQNPGPVLDAFRLACTLEGIATGERAYLLHKGHPCRSIALYQAPSRRVSTLGRYDAGVQPVWCPQTALKTWVMRQGQTITITGNTEIVASEQGSQAMLDGLIRDVEDLIISPTIRKTFLNLMQFADDLDADDVVGAIGTRAAVTLARMSPAERFAAFHGARFKVYGLSAVRARARDFQKLAALLQLVQSNPLMLQAFLRKYSLDATLAQVFKVLNIDPAQLQQTPEEQAEMPQVLERLKQFMALTGQQDQSQSQGGAGMSAQAVGEPGLPAEINAQRTNAMASAGI